MLVSVISMLRFSSSYAKCRPKPYDTKPQDNSLGSTSYSATWWDDPAPSTRGFITQPVRTPHQRQILSHVLRDEPGISGKPVFFNT